MITLRPVTSDDSDLLRKWRNDPETLAGSFTKQPVDKAAHDTWLYGMLVTPLNALYLGLLDDRPIGTVRFHWSTWHEAEISVVLAPEVRGKGYGPELIQAGCRAIRARWGVSRILARIEPTNRRSIRAFEKAGFTATQVLLYEETEKRWEE